MLLKLDVGEDEIRLVNKLAEIPSNERKTT